MSNHKLLQLGLAKTSRQVVRHQTGVCGIAPMPPPPPPPLPPPPKQFPQDLIRPPCMPGSERGRFPPTCDTVKAYYCPSNKEKYSFPPFSENIKFIPGESGCWWLKTKACEFHSLEEEAIMLKI